jgi:hypothetical protein
VLTTPITIYRHLAPRRRPTRAAASSLARDELSEAYAMSERNRPLSLPPPIMPSSNNTHHPHQYPAFITPTEQHTSINNNTNNNTNNNNNHTIEMSDINSEDYVREWIDRAKSALDVFGVLWFIIGNYMIFSSTTCSNTAVPLYYLSMVLIVYGYILLSVPVFLCTSVIFCLPCVLGKFLIFHSI